VSVIATLPRIRRLRLSATLSGYIARQFAWRWMAFYVALSGVILLVATVDILGQLANKEDAGLATIFQLALLKLPYLTQEVMPFTVLFAGMATFWRLTRDHELVVARAAGVSAWQFLLPVVAVALLIGVFTMTVLNPVASTLLGRFEQIEARFSNDPQRTLTVSPNGLWLRQSDRQGQSVIHAARMHPETTTLWQVIVFRFGPEDRFISRIDAARAELLDKRWRLYDARRSDPGAKPVSKTLIELETDLTSAKILDSFAPPETISFWSLPGFIKLLQEAGFSAQRHRLQLHKIAASPVLFTAMILLAATFSLRSQRRGRVALVILAGLLTAFLLYFLSSFVFALGLSGRIPVILAGWAPAGITSMLGIAMLLHLEDG
jgi:lipopolysaccharide export system permease protein